VEALHDYQKAIELNDNRAVYRSKLNLDSDEAARSAAIARVYSDLGFQQRALVEGWSAVNTDPTNFSAHRFLADSYAVRPRHEIARVSELLQSQLLQPNNITPIQPRLAESNLFLVSAQGPGGLSFNEFNPLFNRNRVAVQGSGIVGDNDTYGGEGVASGIYKQFSFSGGYTYFDTDGWRDNADQNDKIGDVFAQYELTYKTSIQAEYRYRDTDKGDVQLRFFEDDFNEDLSEEDNVKSYRLGFRHSFSPASHLIGNFQYSDADGEVFARFPDPDLVFPISIFDDQVDDDAYGGELQYLQRSRYFNLVTGAGYFQIDRNDKITIDLDLGGGLVLPIDAFTEDNDADHYNGYLYSYINPFENITFTVGASYDDFNPDDDEANKDQEQFNPKFGISWNPFKNTTVRGAAFRVLKRSLITDQTLEPTQVAGFNQFFDEFNATDYWVFGGALDQKVTDSIYGGIEYTYRDLNVPYTDVAAASVENSNWDEKIFRAYLFWTPHDWLALRAEYSYEKFDRDEDFANGVKEVDTHLVPIGINFFHPSGLSASLTGTYVDQDGEFDRFNDPDFESGNDDFFLVDAAISYRFPKRYGFLSVGVKNLTDEDFEFYDSDIDNPRFQPDRYFFGAITFALP
jgi:hypothetical protein